MKTTAPLLAALGLSLACALAASAAGDPEGFALWRRGDLAAKGAALRSKPDGHLALDRIGEFGSHFALIVLRDGDGEAELHETWTDFYVVQDGTATLVIGGELVEARATGPGEVRAAAIRGGRRITLAPGDVVNIPPRLPHQVLVPAEGSFTYLILKVKASPVDPAESGRHP